jgi:hypothetical protein
MWTICQDVWLLWLALGTLIIKTDLVPAASGLQCRVEDRHWVKICNEKWASIIPYLFFSFLFLWYLFTPRLPDALNLHSSSLSGQCLFWYLPVSFLLVEDDHVWPCLLTAQWPWLMT